MKINDWPFHLTYRYYQQNNKLLQNRIYHVNETVNASDFDEDIDDQGTFINNPGQIKTANNYSYDAIGQLIKDLQEEIREIKWRVDGKVKEVKRPLLSTKKNLKLFYRSKAQEDLIDFILTAIGM